MDALVRWIEEGADPNDPAHLHYGCSPLYIASRSDSYEGYYQTRCSNKLELTESLLAAKADTEWKDWVRTKTALAHRK